MQGSGKKQWIIMHVKLLTRKPAICRSREVLTANTVPGGQPRFWSRARSLSAWHLRCLKPHVLTCVNVSGGSVALSWQYMSSMASLYSLYSAGERRDLGWLPGVLPAAVVGAVVAAAADASIAARVKNSGTPLRSKGWILSHLNQPARME